MRTQEGIVRKGGALSAAFGLGFPLASSGRRKRRRSTIDPSQTAVDDPDNTIAESCGPSDLRRRASVYGPIWQVRPAGGTNAVAPAAALSVRRLIAVVSRRPMTVRWPTALIDHENATVQTRGTPDVGRHHCQVATGAAASD
uniref:Uncharacterized protein n=1 Tax=Plectus sambesii TaxID=2011161 RepID=A0A914X9Z1_9BILA